LVKRGLRVIEISVAPFVMPMCKPRTIVYFIAHALQQLNPFHAVQALTSYRLNLIDVVEDIFRSIVRDKDAAVPIVGIQSTFEGQHYAFPIERRQSPISVWIVDFRLVPLDDVALTKNEFEATITRVDAFVAERLGFATDDVQQLANQPLRFIPVAEFVGDASCEHVDIPSKSVCLRSLWLSRS
jgi:hypothetical protein